MCVHSLYYQWKVIVYDSALCKSINFATDSDASILNIMQFSCFLIILKEPNWFLFLKWFFGALFCLNPVKEFVGKTYEF